MRGVGAVVAAVDIIAAIAATMAVSPARTVLLVFLVPASVSASVLSVCHHDPCRGRCSPRRIQLSHETAAIVRSTDLQTRARRRATDRQ